MEGPMNALAPRPAPPAVPVRQARLDFASIYDEWFDEVARWLRALGAPDADREDLAQEVFMVVRRRLGDFDGGNLPGWLYRIASRQVRQHRRRVWFRLVFTRRTKSVDDLPQLDANPAVILEKREKRALVDQLLALMSDKRRTAFVLYEIEGYSGEEIAEMQQIPLNTVWTRLHHARREFFALLTQHRRREAQKWGG
jgi:RNA polymerase sigma-70 factor (ECF subfamily)